MRVGAEFFRPSLAGGDKWDIIGGALGGAGGGFIAGGIGGGATGAFVGAASDVIGQVIANSENGKPVLGCLNLGEVAGAAFAGYVGGKGGDKLVEGLAAAGLGKLRAGAMAGAAVAGPAVWLPAIGNRISEAVGD